MLGNLLGLVENIESVLGGLAPDMNLKTQLLSHPI
jgi:hypothetical protein